VSQLPRGEEQGLLTQDQIATQNLNPHSIKSGVASRYQWLSGTAIEVQIGELLARRTSRVLTVYALDVVRIDPPDADGEPPQVFANFLDDDGKPTLRVERNEILVCAETWDVKQEGQVITIRSGPGNIVLELNFSGPNRFEVTRLKMRYKDVCITHGPTGPSRITQGTRTMGFQALEIDEVDAAVLVGLSGVSLGHKAKAVKIANLEVW